MGGTQHESSVGCGLWFEYHVHYNENALSKKLYITSKVSKFFFSGPQWGYFEVTAGR